MSFVRSIPFGRKTLVWLALGLVALGSAPFGARAYHRHRQRVAARAAAAAAAQAQLADKVAAVAAAQAQLADKVAAVAAAPAQLVDKVAAVAAAPAPLVDKVAEVPSEKEMPILGYALTRNGRDYTAYLRWFIVRFPTVGDQMISECRVRFSLEQPGPVAFAIRAFGKPAGDVPPGSPRCHILPLPRPTRTEARVYLPEEQPLGVGDVDGCNAQYNDLGCFINGELHLHAVETNRVQAQVWLTWTGTRGDDLGSDEAQYRLSLEPIADRAQLRVFSEGDRSKGKTAWAKYVELLDELAKPRYRTATLGEVITLAPDERRVTVFLRHDMDLTMYGSLQMAEYEQRRGLRWSYLLNMASSIYGVQARNGRYKVDPHALENLHHIKRLGHEIGYQNDGVAQVVEFNTPMVSWMAHEIGKLRRSGLPVTTQVANGTPYADKYKTWNSYLYLEHRVGGVCCNPETLHGNGRDGGVTVTRDGKQVTYPLPRIHRADAGFLLEAHANQLIPELGPGRHSSYSDCECSLDELIARLRAEPPGQVVELMTHDCRCTSWDPVMDFLVDPAFEDLYRDRATMAGRSRGDKAAPTGLRFER